MYFGGEVYIFTNYLAFKVLISTDNWKTAFKIFYPLNV